MNFLESLRISWRSIKGHKLRSTLTTLGVIIGVGAVIAFMTLGASFEDEIIGDITGEQDPVLSVWAGPEENGGPGAGARPVFTEDDIEEMRKIEGVKKVIPRGSITVGGYSYQGQRIAGGEVIATTPNYFKEEDFIKGRAFKQGSNEFVVNKAAIDFFTQSESTPDSVNVGDTFNVSFANMGTRKIELVGILNNSSLGAFDGFGNAPRVYFPTEPFYQTMVTTDEGEQTVYPLVTVTAQARKLGEAQEKVKKYLQEESDASETRPPSYVFNVKTNKELLGQLREIINTVTGFITGIAVISLIVGSIGIANIMLVSVTERTREIGIMKAVGARRRDILQMFVIESILLGVIGSLFGTLLGAVGGFLLTSFIDIPLVFPLEWVGIAVCVGIIVGVVSGIYPAWRAARTDPIEALRYE